MRWNTWAVIAALAGLVGCVGPGSGGGGVSSISLESDALTVRVDGTFPRVLSYTWNATDATLSGDAGTNRTLRINGTNYTPQVRLIAAGDHTRVRSGCRRDKPIAPLLKRSEQGVCGKREGQLHDGGVKPSPPQKCERYAWKQSAPHCRRISAPSAMQGAASGVAATIEANTSRFQASECFMSSTACRSK